MVKFEVPMVDEVAYALVEETLDLILYIVFLIALLYQIHPHNWG